MRMVTQTCVIFIAFPRQRWLRERASVLRNTCIACLILLCFAVMFSVLFCRLAIGFENTRYLIQRTLPWFTVLWLIFNLNCLENPIRESWISCLFHRHNVNATVKVARNRVWLQVSTWVSVLGTRSFVSEDNITRSFMLCTPHQILFGWSNQEVWDGQGMWHVLWWGEVHIGFWWRILSEGDNLEDLGVVGRIMLKWISEEWNGGTDWIDLVQDRKRWRTVVNAVMNHRFP